MSLVLKRVINGKVFKSWRVSAANGTKQMGQFDGSKRATNSRTSAQTRLSAKPPSLPRADELKHRNPFLASSSWLPNPGELSLIAALALPLAPQARERSQTDGRKASMADQWELRNGGTEETSAMTNDEQPIPFAAARSRKAAHRNGRLHWAPNLRFARDFEASSRPTWKRILARERTRLTVRVTWPRSRNSFFSDPP